MKCSLRKIASSILFVSFACSFVACGDSDSVASAKDEEKELSSSGVSDASSSSSVAEQNSSGDAVPEFSAEQSANSSSDEISSDDEQCSFSGEIPEGWSWNIPKCARFNSEIEYGTLIDERDGKRYRTVVIGEQTWMAENLNYADSIKTPSLKGRIWCHGNDEKCCDVIGRYYTWAAAIDSVALANDPDNPQTCGYMELCELLVKKSGSDASDKKVQGICPSGWHLPSEADWMTLLETVGGPDYIMSSIRQAVSRALRSRSGWKYGRNGDDKYGFSILPAGERGSVFSGEGSSAGFWTASDVDWSGQSQIGGGAIAAYGVFVDHLEFEVESSFSKDNGYSIRCLKD